jgi:hypothetical protein
MWAIELTSAELTVLKVAMADFNNTYKGWAYAKEIESLFNKLEQAEWKK